MSLPSHLPADYAERVYAGVLGKMIGVYLGRPFEGWNYERIMADPFAGKLFGKAVPKAELGLVDMTDLAEIAVFLASPAASKMTGQALSVTGGISAL